MQGTTQDRLGNPVVDAKVTLWLIRETNPFDESGREEAVAWTALTDEKGRYGLQLDQRVLEAGDEIRLVVQAEGFLKLNSSIDPLTLVDARMTAQQLKVTVKEFNGGFFRANNKGLPVGSATPNPRDQWKDETDEFNEQDAATLNGVPILKKHLLVRHSGYLISVREQMQNSAKRA